MKPDFLIVEGDTPIYFSKEVEKHLKDWEYEIAHMGRDKGTYWALLQKR